MESVAAAKSTPLNVTHTNNVQLETLMAAHYSATRVSVDDWLQRRDQYLMLYITGIAVTFGAYLSKPEMSLILNLVPALTIVILSAYLSADVHVAYLCRWLKIEYTALLDKLADTYQVAPLTPWHWDNSASLAKFYTDGAGSLRYIFIALTILLANIAAPVLAATCTRDNPTFLIVTCVLSVLVSFGLLGFIYKKRKTMA